MQNKYWNVLVVDDEADVLTITRLALKRVLVYGLPLKLHECKSKAEAIHWLTTNPEASRLNVAIIDVVMESDTAGLELCEYIRKIQMNYHARILLRTGQAGKAPERDVVDRFDITSYLAKADATEERLYSLVKCCVKDAYSSWMLARTGRITSFLAPHILSPEKFKARMLAFYDHLSHDAQGRRIPSVEGSFCNLWGEDDDHVGTGIFEDRKQAIEIRDRLLKVPMTPLNDSGDGVVNAPDPVGRSLEYPSNTSLFVLPALGDGAIPRQHSMWLTSSWPIPDFAINAMHTAFLVYRPMYLVSRLLRPQGA